MKQRGDRWVVFRLAFGCASRPRVALDAPASNPADQTSETSTQDQQRRNDLCIIKKTKHPLGFRLPKDNLSNAIQRLIRSFKSVSKLFVYKNETDDDSDEDDIEIGYPTDVKHLTHIGWDGSTTVSKPGKQWESLTPSEIITFPSISLEQFELAMAKQAAGASAD